MYINQVAGRVGLVGRSLFEVGTAVHLVERAPGNYGAPSAGLGVMKDTVRGYRNVFHHESMGIARTQPHEQFRWLGVMKHVQDWLVLPTEGIRVAPLCSTVVYLTDGVPLNHSKHCK